MLEGELAKEVENGRLFRMLVKLGFINERPEYDQDPAWHESGELYMLRLFRDHLFHQATTTPSSLHFFVASHLVEIEREKEGQYTHIYHGYVSLQVYDNGGACIDFAHVVDCLNKVDVGTDEKIALLSRDESSLLVVRC